MNQSTQFKVPVSLFIANLKSCKGIPYIWAGKDPHGFDCSGLITFAYKQSGGEDISSMWNCARIIGECIPVNPIDYTEGCLSFYGISIKAPDHVMSLVTNQSGTMTAYGSCGGNHYTTTKEIASRIGACVKERPSIAYRHDFLGVFKWNRIDYTK